MGILFIFIRMRTLKIVVVGVSQEIRSHLVHRLACPAKDKECDHERSSHISGLVHPVSTVTVDGTSIVVQNVGINAPQDIREEVYKTADGAIVLCSDSVTKDCGWAHDVLKIAPNVRIRYVYIRIPKQDCEANCYYISASNGSLIEPLRHLASDILGASVDGSAPTKDESLKIVVAGPARIGKTAHIKRLITGEYPEGKYVPTIGVEVHPVKISTVHHEDVLVNLWDTAGQKKLGGLRDGYYIQADGAIVWLDPNGKDTEGWAADIHRVAPGIPIRYIRVDGGMSHKGEPEKVDRISRFNGNPMKGVLESLVDDILKPKYETQDIVNDSLKGCSAIVNDSPKGCSAIVNDSPKESTVWLAWPRKGLREAKVYRTREEAYRVEMESWKAVDPSTDKKYLVYEDPTDTSKLHVYPKDHEKELREAYVNSQYVVREATLHE
jgi:hypothetical protein